MAPCRDFQRGNCWRGASCKFSHVSQSRPPFPQPTIQPFVSASSSNNLAQSSNNIDILNRRRGPGMAANSPATNHSTIRAPSDSTSNGVCKFFRSGICRYGDRCRDRHKLPTSRTMERFATMPGSGDGVHQHRSESFSITLSGAQISFKAGAEVAQVALHSSQALRTRILPNAVTCRWYRPRKRAFLRFESPTALKRALELFKDISLEGRSLEATHQTHHLRLSNLPAAITADQLLDMFPNSDPKPTTIAFAEPAHNMSDEQASLVVKVLLEKAGAVDYWATKTRATVIIASVQFRTAEGFRKALNELDNEPMAELGNTILHIRPSIDVRMRGDSAVYMALFPELNIVRSQAYVSDNVRISLCETSPAQSAASIRIAGEDAKAVAKHKTKIEELFAGRVALNDNNRHTWSPFFGTAEGRGFLQNLETAHKVLITLEISQQLIKVHGPTSNTDAVFIAINQKAKELGFQGHRVFLDLKLYHKILKGGLTKLASILGTDAIQLDLAAEARVLEVRGTDLDFQRALAILEEIKLPVGQCCAICWGDPVQPIETSCGHVYCQDCFKRQCAVAADVPKGFPIRCLKNINASPLTTSSQSESSGVPRLRSSEDTPVMSLPEGMSIDEDSEAATVAGQKDSECGRAFTMNELRLHLTSPELVDLLRASYHRYIRCHPDEFQVCPTPDCGLPYRIKSTEKRVHCLKCLAEICRSCRASHQMVTCEQYQSSLAVNDGFQEYKKGNRVKDCPKCKAPFVKIEGCNHVICGNCGINICWKCMQTFKYENMCYSHMETEHGGIGDDTIFEALDIVLEFMDNRLLARHGELFDTVREELIVLVEDDREMPEFLVREYIQNLTGYLEGAAGRLEEALVARLESMVKDFEGMLREPPVVPDW